jgi:hypothetical protein
LASCVSIHCIFPRKLPAASSFALGVGHEPEALSDMGRLDTRSRDTDRPAGVSFTFQVRLNKVEPAVPNRCFNLLTKDNSRSALADEIEPRGPQMAFVGNAASCPCDAERLAGARACPNGPVVRPLGEAQGVTPDADSGKEMALGIVFDVIGLNLCNASGVHIPRCYVACGNQIA